MAFIPRNSESRCSGWRPTNTSPAQNSVCVVEALPLLGDRGQGSKEVGRLSLPKEEWYGSHTRSADSTCVSSSPGCESRETVRGRGSGMALSGIFIGGLIALT